MWPFLTLTFFTLSSKFPRTFSRCSQVDLETFVTKPQTGCLTNVPDVNRFVGGPVCGNLFVEHGEQCDCGTPQVCLTSSLPFAGQLHHQCRNLSLRSFWLS